MTSTQVHDLSDAVLAASLDGGFTSHIAEVNGIRLHYVDGGEGAPVLLLGGWPQTWWQWNKMMPALAKRYRVIAVDLRGMGGSDKPADGYDKKTMAADIRALAERLGFSSVSIAGHDIGAMVAYAYAANYPDATGKIALLDVPHPDAGWSQFRLLPEPDQHVNSVIEAGARSYLWWFAFNQVQGLPELLLDGRIRLMIDWLFDRQAKDPARIDEHSRRIYAHAYSTADAVRAGNGWYRTLNTDITHERTYGQVTAPLLALGGDESSFEYLRNLMPAKGTNVTVGEVVDCGHYIPEEQPQAVVDALACFLT